MLRKLFGKSDKVEGLQKGTNMAEEQGTKEVAAASEPRRGRPAKKRGPGRPKGSGKEKPGRPKGSGKRGPGRPKGAAKKKRGRPKGAGRKAVAKGGVSALQARRIAKEAVKAFKAKLPGIIRRELKKLL